MDKELRRKVRALIETIYSNPQGVPEERPVEERQMYRNGYYSVRDLPEFKALVESLANESRLRMHDWRDQWASFPVSGDER